METLISLTKIVSTQKVKKIKLITESGELPYKIKKLYDGIKQGVIKNDEDAIKYLYKDDLKSTQTLVKLKSRLKKRLLNSLFFIDLHQPSFTEHKSAKFELHKTWAIIRLLIDRGNRKVAFTMLNKGIKKTLKFQFTDLTILYAKEFTPTLLLHQSEQEKLEYFQKILEENLDLHTKEIRIEHFSNVVGAYYLESGSPDKTIILNYLKENSKEIEHLYSNNKSYTISYYYFPIKNRLYLPN